MLTLFRAVPHLSASSRIFWGTAAASRTGVACHPLRSLPNRDQINFYRTALHELGHWTGHADRLDRDQKGAFGSERYAREELVAELSAAFTCATLQIQPTVRHSDYIANWLDLLRSDDHAIFRAASQASKAADYLLAFAPETVS